MAGPYYVDIGSPAAWNGRTGLDSTTNCWLGISGLQKAFDTVAAGETCYVKGTGDLSKFYSVAFDAETAPHLTDGEEVTWGADATHGHGVVHWTGADMVTPVEIELLSGAAPANDVEITGVTSGGKIMPTGATVKSLDLDTTVGTNAGGFPRYIGTNSSWGVDDTRANLNGNNFGNHIIAVTTAANYTILRNFEIYSSGGTTKHGISGTSNAVLLLVNCSLHNNSGAGCNGLSVSSFIFRSTSYGNTSYGFHVGNCYFCAAYDNGNAGFVNHAFGCVSHNNLIGMMSYTAGAGESLFSVLDANTSGGIRIYSTANVQFPVILGNRITNHSGAGDFGIWGETGSDEVFILGYNYFGNNNDNIADESIAIIIPIIGGDTTTNIEDSAGITDYGYVDSANHNFSTNYVSGTDPTLRRTAITIPWT